PGSQTVPPRRQSMVQCKSNGSPTTRAVPTNTMAASSRCCSRGRPPSPRLRGISCPRQAQACYSVRYSSRCCSFVRRNLVRKLRLIGVITHHGYEQVGDAGPAYFTKYSKLITVHMVE